MMPDPTPWLRAYYDWLDRAPDRSWWVACGMLVSLWGVGLLIGAWLERREHPLRWGALLWTLSTLVLGGWGLSLHAQLRDLRWAARQTDWVCEALAQSVLHRLERPPTRRTSSQP